MKTQAHELRRKRYVFGLHKPRNQQKHLRDKKDGTALITILILFTILAVTSYLYYF